jgi:hypothetical protein
MALVDAIDDLAGQHFGCHAGQHGFMVDVQALILAAPQERNAVVEQEKVVLENGKYTFYINPIDHKLRCDRYGTPWREFDGDKAVYALFDALRDALSQPQGVAPAETVKWREIGEDACKRYVDWYDTAIVDAGAIAYELVTAIRRMLAAAPAEKAHKEDEAREAWKRGYLAGFMASGEGWNGEYPFQDASRNAEQDEYWIECRDATLAALAAEPERKER